MTNSAKSIRTGKMISVTEGEAIAPHPACWLTRAVMPTVCRRV